MCKAIVNYGPELYKEGDPPPPQKKKWIKDIFGYVLELMLTLDKMLNIMALISISLKSVGRAFRKLFKYLTLYAQFSLSGVLAQ